MVAMRKAPERSIATPISLMFVLDPDGTWFAHWGPHPFTRLEETDDPGRCYLCNRRIGWRYVVLEFHTATQRVLGECCLRRINRSPGYHAKIDSERQKMAFRVSREIDRERELGPVRSMLERHGARMAELPHPRAATENWARKKNLADYAKYWLKHEPATIGDLATCRRVCAIALGLETRGEANARLTDAQVNAALYKSARQYAAIVTRLMGPDHRGEPFALSRPIIAMLVREYRTKLAEMPAITRDLPEVSTALRLAAVLE